MAIFYINGFESSGQDLAFYSAGNAYLSTTLPKSRYYNGTAASTSTGVNVFGTTTYSGNPGIGTMDYFRSGATASMGEAAFPSNTSALREYRHRYGPKFLYIGSSSNNGFAIQIDSTLSDIRFGFAIRQDSQLTSAIYRAEGASYVPFPFGITDGTRSFGFHILANRKIRMYSQSSTSGALTQVGIDSTATVPSTGWAWIEGRIVIGSSGSVSLKIGTNSTETQSGIDTRLGGSATAPTFFVFKGATGSTSYILSQSAPTNAIALIDDIVLADASDGTPEFGNCIVAAVGTSTTLAGDQSSYTGSLPNINQQAEINSNTLTVEGLTIGSVSSTTASALFKPAEKSMRWDENGISVQGGMKAYIQPVSGTSSAASSLNDTRIATQVISVATDKAGKYWRVVGNIGTVSRNSNTIGQGGSLEDDPVRRGNTTEYSIDGIRWYTRSLIDPMPAAPGGGGQINGISYGNGTWVAYGWNGYCFTSTDGTTWTQQSYGVGIPPDVGPNGTQCVQDMQYDTNLSRWIAITAANTDSYQGWAVYISSSATLLSSTWTAYHAGTGNTTYGNSTAGVIRQFAYNGTTYYGSRARFNSLESVFTSNLSTISNHASPANYVANTVRPFFNEIRWGSSKFVIIGGTGSTNRIWTSTALGTSITQATTANPFSATSEWPIRLSFDNGTFVVVSNKGRFAYSSDGLTWTLATGGLGVADDFVNGVSSNWGPAEISAASNFSYRFINTLTGSHQNPFYDGSKWIFTSRLGTAYSSSSTPSTWTYVPFYTPASTSIKAIALCSTARQASTGTINQVLKISGTEYHGPEELFSSVSATNVDSRAIYVKNPATDSAWTESDITSMQFGIRKVT